jgi:hypothetical protein
MAAAYLGDTFRAMAVRHPLGRMLPRSRAGRGAISCRRLSRATCLTMLCALHAAALASPRTDPTQGRAVFTGAATPNPTSIAINPAALGLPAVLGVDATDLSEVYLAGTGVLEHLSIDRRELDINTGALTPGASVGGNLFSPGGMLAYVWHPASRITLAVAAHSSPAERFLENEEALRYHTLGGSYRTFGPELASSFRVTGRFYFGLSLAVNTSFLHFKYARDTALAAGRDPVRGIDSDCDGSPCGVENPAATERYDVDVRSDYVALDNVVGTLGVAVRLAKNMWLGIGYHTPPGLAIQNELKGTMTVERAPRDGGETVRGGASVYLAQPASVDAELRAGLPADLELHVGVRWEHLRRMQAYDVRGFGSFFPGAGIPEWQLRPRGFHESVFRTFAAWAGVEQNRRDFPLNLGARVGFEMGSLPDERTSPITIAPPSATLDAGLSYRFTQAAPHVILQASYGLQYFPTVDVTNSTFDPRAQLSCEDSGFDYSTDACKAVRNGYAIPTAAGEYSRIQQALRIAIRFQW